MSQKLPEHVAIVMDGNGRWAERRGLPRFEGHSAGVETVKTMVRCCLKKNIPALSLFAFSSENWARPAKEVDFLMELFILALKRELHELHHNGVLLRFTGDRTPLSNALCHEMELAEELTANNHQLVLNVMVNYGGKWDIVQAAKTLAGRVARGELTLEQMDEEAFADCLSTRGLQDPDLFIRTSGEQRISNFFLWQLAFTEFYFSDVFWPDFTDSEFEKALSAFSQRERRYGQISQQLQVNPYV